MGPLALELISDSNEQIVHVIEKNLLTIANGPNVIKYELCDYEVPVDLIKYLVVGVMCGLHGVAWSYCHGIVFCGPIVRRMYTIFRFAGSIKVLGE